MNRDARIPVTVLTGYLGAGKTTLLNRILSGADGHRWAVIVNEFGEIGIDHELVTHSNEELFEMNNGCICCTVRGDLIRTVHTLLQRPGRFDGIVVETTGLADPGPVAQTFFMDEEIAEQYLLDSILTLVDAKHAQSQLDDRQEARRQIGFADQIFISKSDLVSKGEVQALMSRLMQMNPRAPQKAVHFGEVAIADVFDLRGFNLNAKLEDAQFVRDFDALIGEVPEGYTIADAAQVAREVIAAASCDHDCR